MIEKIDVKDLSFEKINEHLKSFIKELGDKKGFFDSMNGVFYDEKGGNVIVSDELRKQFLDGIMSVVKNRPEHLSSYDINEAAYKQKLESINENFDGSSKKDMDSLLEIFENFLNSVENEEVSKLVGFGKNGNNIYMFNSLSQYRNKLKAEDKDLMKEYDDKFYNIQKQAFGKLLEAHRNDDYYMIDEGKEYLYRYLFGRSSFSTFYEINKDALKQYISKAEEMKDLDQFSSLTKYQVEHLGCKVGKENINNLISDPDVNKKIQSLWKESQRDVKKIQFKRKIERATYNIKSSIGVVLICSVFAAGLVGSLHHLGAVISRNISMGQDMVQIETNVKDGVGLAKFTGNAILATETDGKYYVEIFGIGVKQAGGKPEFCSATYEIEKDLYDVIYKYYDIEYKYGKEGQLVGASNNIRTNLEACGLAKANRANWKVKEILAEEITKKDPVSITWQNANADAIDVDVEPEM